MMLDSEFNEITENCRVYFECGYSFKGLVLSVNDNGEKVLIKIDDYYKNIGDFKTLNFIEINDV